MAKIAGNISEITGRTPLLRLNGYEKKYNLKARVLAKLEFLNPSGSVKDRGIKTIIRDAEKTGALRAGQTIIEPTGGNAGVSLAALGRAKGYEIIIVMPENMGAYRAKVLEAYGAKVIFTDSAGGMKGAVSKAEAISSETGAFYPNQFLNASGVKAHKKTTGPEIWEDTCGETDIFIAGIGTGATFCGTAAFLKSKNPSLYAIAVEPAQNAVLSGKSAGRHGIFGLGASFMPSVFDASLADEIFTVSDGNAYDAAGHLARTDGVLAGPSSGAALFAAREAAKKTGNIGKTIVIILPDGGGGYVL